MKIYHIEFDTDKELLATHSEMAATVRAADGEVIASRNGGFHLTKAVLVVVLPDKANIKKFTSLPYREVPTDGRDAKPEEVPTVPVVTPEEFPTE